jgi:serine phosphatase RsbU (regulator of sigma subunit)
MMPNMTGAEFCTKVREDPALRHLPFVLLTARSSYENKISGLELGADDYLAKPFSELELLVRVRNLITLRKQTLELKGELRAAREIQRVLLPPSPSVINRLVLESLYRPTDELSGDFYDWVCRPPWVYVYVADVASHGTAAAQITYLVKATFQNAIETGDAPELPELMNRFVRLFAPYKVHHTVGIQVARVHCQNGDFQLIFGNAPNPFVVGSGVRPLVGRPGPALSSSMGDSVEYQPIFGRLDEGESLMMLTDGCLEFAATDSRPFGLRRFSLLLRGAAASGWQEKIWSGLVAAHGSESFEDDMTLLSIRRTQG